MQVYLDEDMEDPGHELSIGAALPWERVSRVLSLSLSLKNAEGTRT